MRIKIDIRIKRGVFKLNKRAASLLRAKPGQVLRMREDEDGNVMLGAMDDDEDIYTGKLCKMSTSGLSCSNASLARRLLGDCKTGAFRVGDGVYLDDAWWVYVITRKNYANQEFIF